MSRWKRFIMDIIKKMRWERPLDLDHAESQEMTVASHDAPKQADSLTSILRLVQSDADANASVVVASPSSSQDWANLIDRVRAAAQRTREVEAQAQAEQRIRAAEERAEAAEERARIAEDWLKQVHEAIVSEFSTLTEVPSKAA